MTTSTKCFLLGLTALSLAACSDDEETSTPTAASQENQNLPQIADADAVLVAIKTLTVTQTPIGEVPTQLGTAVAVFTDGSSEAFVDAGTVTINEEPLTRNENNSYTYIPSATNPTGLDLSDDPTWEASGNGSVPPVFGTPTNFFPEAGSITSSATVTRSQGYTLTVGSVTGADSVLFNIGGVVKTLAGNATSCTFSSDELSALSAGSNVAQAAAYSFDFQDEGPNADYRTYYIKEFVVTKTVSVE